MNLLLDLDGTLTDSVPGITRSIQVALKKLGLPKVEAADLVQYIGPPLTETFSCLLPDPNAENVAEAIALYRASYVAEGIFENSVYPGIEKVLAEYASMGVGLYLATSKPRVYAVQILEHFKLDHFFKAIHGSELDGTRQDKTQLIKYILETEGLDPQHTAMVGDRSHDMVGGRNNQVQTVGVLWGYGSRPELVDAGADMIIEQPADLGWLFEYYQG